MDFMTYWQYADVITKTLFYILFILSLFTWFVGLVRLYHSYQLRETVETALVDAASTNKQEMNVLSLSERKLIVEQLLLRCIAHYRYKGEKGLSILGTIAAIAPFIGLFGTVWGIFHALRSIGESGQAGLSQVAGPVGEALIMTGFGLAVAIPAVVFYNLAMRFNRSMLFLSNDSAYRLLLEAVRKS